MEKEVPVFDQNHSKLIVKIVEDEVSNVVTELELLKMFITKDFVIEILN